MKLNFSLNLPDPLATELNDAAQETELTPEEFAAQALESQLASRRLETVLHGRCGPRVKK